MNNNPGTEQPVINRELLSLSFFLILFLIVSILFFNIIKIFLIPLVLAVTFSSLFYPLYKKILVFFKSRKNPASFTLLLIIVICVLIPTYFIGYLVVQQAVDFYTTANEWVKNLSQQHDGSMLGFITDSALFQKLPLSEIDIQSVIQDGLKTTGTLLTGAVNKVSSSVIEMIVMVFLTLYSMFYLFRDGEMIIEKLRQLSPLKEEYEDKLIERFSSISRATIKGTVVIGIIQGVAGIITFIAFGIPGWILWGIVMTLLSIIPVVGSFLIMIPVALLQIVQGHVWQGIVIIFVAIVLNYAIDYLLRPVLVGHESKMHDLLIFFSSMGGLALYGVMGFIIGPIIAMLFITLLDIYSREFQQQLDDTPT